MQFGFARARKKTEAPRAASGGPRILTKDMPHIFLNNSIKPYFNSIKPLALNNMMSLNFKG